MQTKHMRAVKVLSASALALGMIVSLDVSAQTAGIAGTRHNLGSSNRTASGNTVPSTNLRAGDLYTTNTAEICVFCHTPHGSQTTGVVNAPLWNKGAPSTGAYTVYASGTMQGAASLSNGNMSLACLSCHDGTQAMDNMVNATSTGWTGTPGNHGSAGYTAGGANKGYTWYAGNTTSEGDATISGAMNAGIYMELGTDLTNDHPVGMPYCGGGLSVTNTGTCSDTDFNTPSAGVGGMYVVGSATPMKNNMRLYTFNSTLNVECGSCHDPHNGTNTSFLRIPNTGSAVCLTCHIK